MTYRNLLLAGAGYLAAGALVAASPWDGTWKLNPAKSQLAGYTFTYSAAAGGRIHHDDGGPEPFDFTLDGKPYTTPYQRIATWTPAGPNAWDREWKLNGSTITKGRTTLSADGKTLTGTYEEIRADGSVERWTEVSTKVAGGDGLLGTWKNQRSDATPETVIITVPEPGRLVWESPAWKFRITGATDGSLMRVEGPTVTSGVELRMKADGPFTFTYESKHNGKVDGLGSLALGDEGRRLTVTSWIPAKPEEKTVAVYDKQ